MAHPPIFDTLTFEQLRRLEAGLIDESLRQNLAPFSAIIGTVSDIMKTRYPEEGDRLMSLYHQWAALWDTLQRRATLDGIAACVQRVTALVERYEVPSVTPAEQDLQDAIKRAYDIRGGSR